MRERPSRTKPQVEEELPASLYASEVELGLLSCFLGDPKNLIGKFHEIGSLEWFHHPTHRLIAEEMFWLMEEKGEFDETILCRHFIDKQLLDKIGGASFVSQLGGLLTPAHFVYYCEILSEKHLLRQSWAKVGEAKEALIQHHDNLQEKGDIILGHLAVIEALFREQDKALSLADQINAWNEDWEAKAKGEKSSAMPTRWPILNLKMGGLNDGYTIIAGEYSGGKSVLMRNLMVDACISRGRPGLICNYETGISSTISGMVCDMAGIPTEIVFRPDQNTPSSAQRKSISWALGKISGSKLKIIHEPHLSAEGIVSKARTMKEKEGDLVVAVDYLQKIPRPSYIEKGANQERELATNSDTIQKLSKEMPVLMACQINKDGSSRGSEAILMDADIALKIEGNEGIFIKKFKEGARNYHLPLTLDAARLRFVESEPTFP